MPANLQGIWHNNVDGPWRVDYHNNINIQMNYWPACSTNLEECMLPLIDFIRTLVKPGEKTAQSYFGARGWTASISANIFGFTAPLESQDMSWNFNPMAGPWLATHIWEYYDYTRDLKFLKETGYELIKSSANFAVDYLWHKPDGTYIAAPSANTSGRPSPTTAQHVYEDLNGRIDMIIDSGKVDIGLESTIVDLTGEIPTILRPGYITKAMLEEAVGPVTIDKAILADHEDPNLRPKAPGMKYKHYAPKGDLVIVEGKKQAVAETINHLTKMDAEAGLKTAVIASDENLSLYDADCKINIGSREHEESIAANLYEVLREMDEMGVQKMYSESFAGGGLGAAIMNRLLKAAGHHVIRV